jgi:hypothetical protein
VSAEFGQMMHDNPIGHKAPPIVHAVVSEIRGEIERVFWNVNQRVWGFGEVDYGKTWGWNTPDLPENGTGIPGLAWRAYYNWGGCPSDDDWDKEQAALPNFSFEGVEVRWYKRYGRSMNVNVVWSAEKWNRWLERCLQTLRAYEDENSAALTRDPTPYPDKDGAVPLDTLEARINCMACVCIDVADGKEPRFEPEDWRWCQALDWVTRLGQHAMKAPGKLELHEEDE